LIVIRSLRLEHLQTASSFFIPNAGKALFAVDEESLVGDDYLVCDNFFKRRELGLTLSAVAIFLNQLLEPADGVFGELF